MIVPLMAVAFMVNVRVLLITTFRVSCARQYIISVLIVPIMAVAFMVNVRVLLIVTLIVTFMVSSAQQYIISILYIYVLSIFFIWDIPLEGISVLSSWLVAYDCLLP